MIYQDTLKNQWENLCADFEKDFDITITKGNIPACLNEWYKVRAYRWRSLTYSEGIILEQNTSSEFAEKLLELIESFSFKSVESTQKKSFLPKIAIGVILGIVIALLSKLCFFDTVKSYLLGSALCVMFCFFTYKRASTFNQNENQRVKSEYVKQLKDHYLKHLLKLCKSYEQ